MKSIGLMALEFFLRGLLSSFFLVVFLISGIVGHFPPGMGEIKSLFSSLREFTRIEVASLREVPQALSKPKNLQFKHQILSEIHQELGSQVVAQPKSQTHQALPQTPGSLEVEGLSRKLREVESQLYRLQNRVGQLEGKTK